MVTMIVKTPTSVIAVGVISRVEDAIEAVEGVIKEGIGILIKFLIAFTDIVTMSPELGSVPGGKG
jgi:hypothetical protein